MGLWLLVFFWLDALAKQFQHGLRILAAAQSNLGD